MKYVLDTSVAIKQVVVEADSDKAIQLIEEFANAIHELIAPDLFPSECANVLMNLERKGTFLPGQAATHFQDIINNAPVNFPATPLIPRAIEIALQHRQTVYDCLYVALAEREGCELVTADDKLVNALQATMPFVIRLSSLP